ncbi:MAG: hypothetical protein Fur0046_03990 [Cyanobacteria bacterium J069]|nr:MAG: DUF4203 domain-containing protein [Cyanobacteria bacterium J069]
MLKPLLLALFSGLFGVLLCFAGYRFFMIMLPVWSFFAGLWLGAKAVFLLLGGGFLATTTGLTVGLVLGILLAVFCWQFYEVGVALMGAATGALFGASVMAILGFQQGPLPALVALGSGLVLGGLTYVRHWQKYLVMVLSAQGGANALVLSLLLNGRVSIEGLKDAGNTLGPIFQDSWFWLLLWTGLAIAGFFYQIRRYRQVEFAKGEFVRFWM